MLDSNIDEKGKERNKIVFSFKYVVNGSNSHVRMCVLNMKYQNIQFETCGLIFCRRLLRHIHGYLLQQEGTIHTHNHRDTRFESVQSK